LSANISEKKIRKKRLKTNENVFDNLEFETLVRSLYNSMANYAGTNLEIDRSLCEFLLQMLIDSLGMMSKTPHDAYR